MRNLPKWPILVNLATMRALSLSRFLSICELTENEYLILRIKEGHTKVCTLWSKYGVNARNGILCFISVCAFVACGLTCFWTGIWIHHNARIGIGNTISEVPTRAQRFMWNLNAPNGINLKSQCAHWIFIFTWECANSDHCSRLFFSKILLGEFCHKKRVSGWQWPAKIWCSPILASLCAHCD